MREAQPNILLIMSDQQRADSLGCSGGGAGATPVLDACAQRGVLFENAYSSSTTCVPARVSLLTGLLPNRTPLAPGSHALREGFWTIARELHAAGYATGLFGKMHMTPMRADHGFEQLQLCEHLGGGYGLDAVDDYRRWLRSTGRRDTRFRRPSEAQVFPYAAQFHPTSWITARATEFIDSREASRPWFTVVSYAHPHTPYDPPQPWAGRYRAEDQQLPADGCELNRDLPQAFRDALDDTSRSSIFSPVRVDSKPELHVRGVLAAIRALVRQIDDAVGELLRHVDLARTVVFFTSDHGDYGAHRGFLGKSPWIPFDDLARVPFLAFGAGIPAGRRIATPVQSFDYVPTALEFAGLGSPYSGIDSQSLGPLLRGEDAAGERPVLSETRFGWPMVRRGRMKHIWHFFSDSHALFDLDLDPAESRNLAADPAHAELIEENRTLLRAVLNAPVLS